MVCLEQQLQLRYKQAYTVLRYMQATRAQEHHMTPDPKVTDPNGQKADEIAVRLGRPVEVALINKMIICIIMQSPAAILSFFKVRVQL